MKDVVVGGSGWVSSVAIELLLKKFGTNLNSLYVYGSRARIQKIDEKSIVEIKEWNVNEIETEVRFFIPAAFLTVDKFDVYGELEYRKLNEQLIQKAADFVAQNSPKFCVLVSSGITNSNLNLLNRSLGYRVYRELKLQEEYLLKHQCKISGTNLLVCRLFSASGNRVNDYQKYAISNFAFQGLGNRRIIVESSFPIFRKYVDMSQLLEICLYAVQDNLFLEFDSTGCLVELHDLASIVARKLSIAQENYQVIDSNVDNYFSNRNDMENLALKYGISLFSIEKQVEETIEAVRHLIRGK